MKQIGVSGRAARARSKSPAEASKLFVKLTESSDPAASQLFKECFMLMDQGRYRDARLKIVTYIEGKPIKGNEFAPPAWWLIAWCLLNEGGKKNLLDAALRFSMYAKLWPAPGELSVMTTAAIAEDYEELTKTALFNGALLYTDLSRTTHVEQSENDKYISNAKEELNSFMAKWPNDPQVPEVRSLLDSLDMYNPKP